MSGKHLKLFLPLDFMIEGKIFLRIAAMKRVFPKKLWKLLNYLRLGFAMFRL